MALLGFRDYLGKKLSEVPPEQTQPTPSVISWNPSKKEILDHWTGLQEGPVKLTPIPSDHEGSTYLKDTIRITGTKEFIDSAIAHLKDLLKYESETTQARVIYRESRDRVTDKPTGFYSFYFQAREK